MSNYSWPSPFAEPEWEVESPPIAREIVHAVGAIAIGWTHCEDIYLGIILDLAGYGFDTQLNARAGYRIFHPLGNRQRSEILMALIEEANPPKDLREVLVAFRTHFDICLANRNLVVHASFIEEEVGTYIASKKAHPKISERLIPTEFEFWEERLAEVKRLYKFGGQIIDEPMRSRKHLWPDIPPAPQNLASILPAQGIVPRQPLSFEQ